MTDPDESVSTADALADRRVYQLGAKRWDEFVAALDDPLKTNPRLRKLLARTPKWKA